MSVGKCFTAWRVVKRQGGAAGLRQPVRWFRCAVPSAQSGASDAKPREGDRQEISKH